MLAKNKQLESIASLLPEGLTEDALTEIASLVQDCINEEVDKKVSHLSNQVFGFIRLNMDSIKESALNELSEESELYRNAALFENVRSLMAMELAPKDMDNAVDLISEDNDKLSSDVTFLTNELDKALSENSRLEQTASVLEAKVKTYNTKIKQLKEEVKNSLSEDFNSSEKAIIIQEAEQLNLDSLKSDDKNERPDYTGINEALTPEVMDLIRD